MKEESVFRSGVEPSPSLIGSLCKMPDEETLGAGLVNVRVLAGNKFCKRVAAVLEPLGLVTTGFEPDPHGTPNIYRMFLAGKVRQP